MNSYHMRVRLIISVFLVLCLITLSDLFVLRIFFYHGDLWSYINYWHDALRLLVLGLGIVLSISFLSFKPFISIVLLCFGGLEDLLFMLFGVFLGVISDWNWANPDFIWDWLFIPFTNQHPTTLHLLGMAFTSTLLAILILLSDRIP